MSPLVHRPHASLCGTNGSYNVHWMPPKLAIIAALPREIAALVRGIKPDATLVHSKIHLYVLPKAIVVAGGMGETRASLAAEAALSIAPVTTLVSVGLAGACTPQLKPGDLSEPRKIINVRNGARFVADSCDDTVLASADVIASVGAKRWLVDTYPADLVDMEAAGVAGVARSHGLRFRAIKAISDAYDFEIGDLNRFASPQGEFRTAALALHTALRPATWSKAAELGRNSSLALTNLHSRLLEIIAAEPVS